MYEGNKGSAPVRSCVSGVVVLSLLLTAISLFGQDEPAKKTGKINADPLSFRKDVFPIIEKKCLPCHSSDNLNPSELSLDDYEGMEAGGKNGPAWLAGKPDESNLVRKLSEKPPFGERMPLNSKKKIAEGRARWLTDDEIKTIAQWIEEGAKNN
jgi:hypothetical protein